MQIEFQDEFLTLDIEDIKNSQAMFIYKFFNGLTVMDLLEGMDRLDPRVMLALFWLAHEQSGKRIDMNQADFAPIKFMVAIKDALNREKGDAPVEDPKDEPDSEASTPQSIE